LAAANAACAPAKPAPITVMEFMPPLYGVRSQPSSHCRC
jgi:hypothetical protein